MLLGVEFKSKKQLESTDLLSEAGLVTYAVTKQTEFSSPNLKLFSGPIRFIDEKHKMNGPGLTLAPIIAQALSRVCVSLKSNNTYKNLAVDPNYLFHPQDIKIFEYGSNLCCKITSRYIL